MTMTGKHSSGCQEWWKSVGRWASPSRHSAHGNGNMRAPPERIAGASAVAELKRLVADLSLDRHMLPEIAFRMIVDRRMGVGCGRDVVPRLRPARPSPENARLPAVTRSRRAVSWE